MKTLNKLFIFGVILIMLINIFPVFTFADVADGCGGGNDLQVEARVYQYYHGGASTYAGPKEYPNAKQEYFKCSAQTGSGWTQVIAPYYAYVDGHKQLVHTSIYVNTDKFPLDLDDILIDVDGGRLVVSGMMHDDKDAWNKMFTSISGVIVGITGLGVLICLFAMIMQIIKLGASAGNPMEREKALMGILWTGIGIAGCGAAALIFGLAYNIL
jgi:hypothetical protein